jgi:RHS repeat-associated protein
MLCAAQEKVLEPPMVWRGEEIVFLAVLSAVEPETHIGASKVNDEKPHQGVAGKNPAPHLGQALCNSTIALGASWCWWPGTALGAGDSYDYDAFGNLISSTGTTPNVYLFAGEQYDSALGLYYNRARYLNTTTGRFWSMDDAEGEDERPTSLHKYLYDEGNPVDNLDPTGNEIDEVMGSFAVAATINAMPTLQMNSIVGSAQNVPDIHQLIADKAHSYLGSTRWREWLGSPLNCNLYVSDVLREVGASVPTYVRAPGTVRAILFANSPGCKSGCVSKRI